VNKYFTDSQGDDLRLSQQAAYYLLAGSNMDAGSYGFLEIHYVVRFFNPQQAYQPVSGQAAKLTGGGLFSDTDIMGTAPIYDPMNSFKVTWSPSGLTLPKGRYWVVVAISGSGLISALTCEGEGNVEVTELFSVLSSTTASYSSWTIDVPDPNGVCDFTLSEASIVASIMNITLLPTGMSRFAKSKKHVTMEDLSTLVTNLCEKFGVHESDVDNLFLKKPKQKSQPKLTSSEPKALSSNLTEKVMNRWKIETGSLKSRPSGVTSTVNPSYVFTST
jgi:hypothetical protein